MHGNTTLLAICGAALILAMAGCGKESSYASGDFHRWRKSGLEATTTQGFSPPPYRVIDLGQFSGSMTAMNSRSQLTGFLDDTRSFVTDAGGQNLRPVSELQGAVSINNRGDIVGHRPWEFGTHPAVHYSDGRNQELVWVDPPECAGGIPDLRSCDSVASDINDWRQIVGTYASTYRYDTPGYQNILFRGSRGFVYSAGQFIDLGSLGGPETIATAINAKGHITGSSDSWVDPRSSGQPASAFIYRDGQMEPLSGLVTTGGIFAEPVLRSRGYDINDSDAIVGIASPHRAHGQAFLWENGEVTLLGALNANWFDVGSEAFAINNYRQVLGQSGGRSFLWQDGVMMGLTDLVDSPTFTTLSGIDINDEGHIAAIGLASDGAHSLLLVPEAPATARAIARFDGSNGKGAAPSTQYFDGTLSHSTAPGAWIASCEWDFGDGSPKVNQCWASHTYQTSSPYTAVLRVTDSTGAVGRAFLPVDLTGGVRARMGVTANKPLDDADFVLTGDAPLTVYLDATASTTDAANAWIQSFEWDFGDGTKSFGHAWVEHTYDTPGHYAIRLRAVDSAGHAGQVVKTLSVLEKPKTAQAVARFDGSSGIGNAPTTQYFDGTLSHSSAPGAWIVSCKWDFGDYTTSDSCWTEHTYQSNRDFAVTLTVVDSTGSIDSAQLKVQAGRAIHARARLDGSPPQGAAPLTAYFDATTSSTDEQAAWISSFEWDFGDGSPKSNAGWTPHVYAAPGQYTATLKVTDSKGNSAYDFVLVTVQ